jgi:Mrp family chromosome partitioning ATPase
MKSQHPPRVTVTVSGPTGSGKSHIALEIEVALRAAGIKVAWSDIDGQRQMEAEAHSEATGGWQPEMPEVLLQEINTPISIADGMQRLNK